MNCSDHKFPDKVTLVTDIAALSPAFMSMLRHANCLEIQALLLQKKNPFGAKICINISFQRLLYIMKLKSQEDQ